MKLFETPQTNLHLPSREEIAAAETTGEGFTRRQLSEWGVSWPPPHGWRRRLEHLADQRNGG